MSAVGDAESGPIAEARTLARYLLALPRFLRTPISREEAARHIQDRLAAREANFLRVLREGVYGWSDSPYPALFAASGAEREDVERLVGELGIEGALSRLYDAGVRITLDEFKAANRLFDNPLATEHYPGTTGGSRQRRRVKVDLDMLKNEAAHQSIWRAAFDLDHRPYGLYRVIPPSTSGVNNCLRQYKSGGRADRWWSPHRGGRDAESIKFGWFTRLTVLTARASGARMPWPEHCPPAEAVRVARWLADCRAQGDPAVLDAQAGLAVRVCLGARAEGLDLTGTLVRVGGEPLTAGKRRAVEAVGCQVISHYTMSETGRIAVACADPEAADDHHFLSDKLAVIQRELPVGGDGGATVGALVYTTLLPSSPKLMINVESGDYGGLVERPCGCPLGALGLTTHVNDIRSYNKLTAEGNHFLGSDLLALVDEVLPARFGGGPTDYQLVEEEVDGLPKVTVVVGPTVGSVRDDEVIDAVLSHLASQQRLRLMTEVWRDGDTLRVVRREPHRSWPAGKILPLAVSTGERSAA